MKRTTLTVLFTLYYIFSPFVILNCSVVDEQYDVLNDEPEQATISAAECEAMEFLSADCVDVLLEQEEERLAEESKISSALNQEEDFQSCRLVEDLADDSSSESESTVSLMAFQTEDTEDDTEADTDSADESTEDSEDTAALDCAPVIEDLVDAYQICASTSEDYDGCDDILDTVDQAVTDCDSDSEDVSDDFCASLTA
ncbi:MAG: hypothetical protein H7A33_04720 [Deltaproteobacteria bacterium]|nr:hypothetical protein [Deltaproteobacteria bacterium]